MSYSALSASFEYLCYGSTTIINILINYSGRIDFRCQILTYKDGPRAERFNHSNENERKLG